MSTLLIAEIGLVGDFTMTLPATVEFIKRCREVGEHVDYWPHQDAERVWSMFPHEVATPLRDADRNQYSRIVQFNLHRTAGRSSTNGWYGSQGFFDDIGLPVPSIAPRAELHFVNTLSLPTFDYGLAPFARSLPEHERWQREKWQAVVDARRDLSFALYGDGALDDPEYVTGPNVTRVVGHSLREVTESIANLRRGLISVSTGLAHLAYAVGQRLIFISNQGSFTVPPTAVRPGGGTTQPDQIAVDQILAVL